MKYRWLGMVWLGVHGAAWGGEAELALAETLTEVLADDSLAGAKVSGIVLDAASSQPIWSMEPDRPQNPASCQKLVTSLVALDSLGPAHVFNTTLEATGHIEQGRLDGDLIVRGGGDPELFAEHWWALVRLVRSQGIVEITGDVVLDPSIFGPVGAIPGWPGGDDKVWGKAYEAPVSGLALNFNALVVQVAPGDKVGDAVSAGLILDTAGVVIENTATTSSGSRDKLAVKRFIRDNKLVVTVGGTLGVDASTSLVYRSLPDPMAYAGEAFVDLLRREGVAVGGTFRSAAHKDKSDRIASFPSRPLWVLLGDMNKYSSNHIAEMLLRSSSVASGNAPTPDAASAHAVQTLESYGIDMTGAEILNGSGLTRTGKLTARQLASVVHTLAHHPKWGPEALTSMAVYGRDGTVRRRLSGADLVGDVRVKTGMVRGVLTLAGHVTCEGGRPVDFAVMYEGLRNAYRAIGTWNGIVQGIHDYCRQAGG